MGADGFHGRGALVARQRVARASRKPLRSGSEKARDKSFVAVAEKLFATLETFTFFREGELTLDEITKRNGLPKSTTHRLLTSLERLGYLAQNGDSGRYSLGNRFFELANSTLPHQRLIAIARPYLQSLMFTFDESTNLGVYDGGLAAHIFTVECPRPYRVAATVGARAHLHCTSMGKAIAAHLPSAVLEKAFLKYGLPQRTRNTLASMSSLEEDLQRVRETGVSHDNQEDVEGVECFGAPIFNAEGQVVASMSISGPSIRMAPQAPAVRSAVRETARRISWVLGYATDPLQDT